MCSFFCCLFFPQAVPFEFAGICSFPSLSRLSRTRPSALGGLPALPPPFAGFLPFKAFRLPALRWLPGFRVLVFARASWPVPNSLFISFRAVCSLFSSSPVFFKQFAFFLKLPSPFRAVCSLFPNFLVSFAWFGLFSQIL